MKKINIAIIGINGFGRTHLNLTEKLERDGVLKLAAICEINYENNKAKIAELVKRGVKYYSDYNEMLKNERGVDFVSISTPLHLHRKMAVDVMKGGCHVLLEKPPAVTIQDIDEIIGVSEAEKKYCAIDFMMTSGKACLELKRHIREGKLGRIVSISGYGLWKRLDDYYQRTPWAGRLMINNSYVLDGSMTNPLSHILNNVLLLACASGRSSVSAVTAELYHAHSIEGEDTSCIKAEMDNGIDLFFYTTLCNSIQLDPVITVEGTEGRAVWNIDNSLDLEILGQKRIFKYDKEDLVKNMYLNLCSVISGEENTLYCSAADTRNFVLAANGAHESSGGIHSIPAEFIHRYAEDDSMATDIDKIDILVKKAFEEKKLYSDLEIPWAVRGKRFNLDGYTKFEASGK